MTRSATTRWVCLLAVLFTAAAQGQTYHDNVVIILDGSGSMSEGMRNMSVNKMAAAKNALKEVLSNLPENIDVGLLVFSGSVRDPWVYPLGPLDIDAVSNAIDRVRSGGGTPLGAYLKIGADRLLKAREEQFGYGSYRLLIVTDGQASDEYELERNTPEVLARGITVDVIGVDMETEHNLAQQAHSYRSADDPESLKQAVAQVFAEVGGSASDSAESDFEVLEGIPVEVAQAIVSGLARQNNAPIAGVKRASSNQFVPRNNGVVPSPASQPPQSSSSSNRGFSCMMVPIIAFIMLISIINSAKRRAR